MSKKSKHKIILIGGIRYYADKPDTCRKCFFLEEPQGRLHPWPAELLLSGRACHDGAGEKVQRLLLCQRSALRQRRLLQGSGCLAADGQSKPDEKGRAGKCVSKRSSFAITKSFPRRTSPRNRRTSPAAASAASTTARTSNTAGASFPDACTVTRRLSFARIP